MVMMLLGFWARWLFAIKAEFRSLSVKYWLNTDVFPHQAVFGDSTMK